MQREFLDQKKKVSESRARIFEPGSDSQPENQDTWVWVDHKPLEHCMTSGDCVPLSDLGLTSYEMGCFTAFSTPSGLL